ncbi:hypothetical protein [Clostridium chromiireducens]|uniref:BIG2 domain-containing protein n=1 Tax=Clostridium chromiireducens TaxID=225345 RepID=A0A1V4IV67_9CLOT|nr:hypothetical protein [Clostridium chromiireducens]OPJ63674.1 hypothetical protein CLCHR_14890 [Clostridium chromiireducens]
MDISFYSGDSRNLVISVTDENNNAINLNSATIKWVLIDNKDSAILSKEVGNGIKITNPTSGQFTISVLAQDTKNLEGNYKHMARVTTSSGESSIVLTGSINIMKSLI